MAARASPARPLVRRGAALGHGLLIAAVAAPLLHFAASLDWARTLACALALGLAGALAFRTQALHALDLLCAAAGRQTLRAFLERQAALAVELEATAGGLQQLQRLVDRQEAQRQAIAATLERKTGEIMASARKQQLEATQQLAAATQVSAATGELATSAREIAHNARMVAEAAQRVKVAVGQGRQQLLELVASIVHVQNSNETIHASISALRRHVESVLGLVRLINDIADRSDLLALNAALEGTKAGEAGRSFLLVAQEMRALSERVIGSTQVIKRQIQQINETTNQAVVAVEAGLGASLEGVEKAEQAEVAFNQIVRTIEETSDSSRQISLSTEQQRIGAEDAARGAVELAEVAHGSLALVESTVRTLHDLDALPLDLKQAAPPAQGLRQEDRPPALRAAGGERQGTGPGRAALTPGEVRLHSALSVDARR